MPKSLWDAEVQAVFDQARVSTLLAIRVGDRSVIIPTPFPSPADWRDINMYFLLVDRFHNPNAQPHHLPWDSTYSDFQGGTFEGVRQKLDYLQQMGVNAIWLSPVSKNCQYSPTYHGYGIQDFLSIDPRFASDPAQAAQNPALAENELRALIDEAHAHGIYVIFDIVLHHTGDVFAYQQFGSEAPWSDQPYAINWRDEHGVPRPDWSDAPADPPGDAAVWPQELRNNAYFLRQGNAFSRSPDLAETGGDFYSLKQLAFDYQDGTAYPVHDTLIRAYNYLIAKYDIDGFRIDTLKYISPNFARNFGNAVREFALSIGKKNFFTFGEVYDSEEKIAYFIGRNAMNANDPIGVDAALDYPLFYRLPGVAKGEIAPSEIAGMFEYRKQVESSVISSHGDVSGYFVTFLDNHDQFERFFYRDPGNPDAYDAQLELGLACLFTLPGVPCLYYGTEQGLSGGGSAPEAVREALWGKPDAFKQDGFYQTVQQLTAVRNDQPALRYGRHYFRPISGDAVHFGISTTPAGVLAFSRILNDQEVIVVANTSTQESWAGAVIVDLALNPVGAMKKVLYSNNARFENPGPVMERAGGTVQITEVNGTISQGPVHFISVNLRPMEVQIIGR